MILHRQVLESCFDRLVWCLCLSSSAEWTVYEMACFLCFPRCPQLLCFSAWVSECCRTLTRSYAVALWRLVKEFYIFSSCCSHCLLEFYTSFPQAPCFWQPPAPVRCDSPRRLFENFFPFLREKWNPVTLQFTLGNLKLFLRAVPGSHRVRQSTLLLEEFHICSSCWLSRTPRAVFFFALENLDIFLLAVIWRRDGFFGGSDAFFALLQVVWS